MGIQYEIGLDLGRDVDYTAWAALEVREYYWHIGKAEYVLELADYKDVDLSKTKKDIGLIGLSQIPLHTPWGTVAKELEGLIARCLQRETQPVRVEVWVDATGLGDPVIEGFFEPVVSMYQNCWMFRVRITPGEAGYDSQTNTVSKIHLIDNAMVLREQGDLKIAKELEGSRVMELFEQQIQDFRRKAGARAGTIRYEAIEGEHDDLVIAFSLACLGVEQSRRDVVYVSVESITHKDLGIE